MINMFLDFNAMQHASDVQYEIHIVNINIIREYTIAST